MQEVEKTKERRWSEVAPRPPLSPFRLFAVPSGNTPEIVKYVDRATTATLPSSWTLGRPVDLSHPRHFQGDNL